MVDSFWGEVNQDGGLPSWWIRFCCEENQDGGLPSWWIHFWGQEHQDGGLPSWWIHFGVKNIKMEAYHHGGSILG